MQHYQIETNPPPRQISVTRKDISLDRETKKTKSNQQTFSFLGEVKQTNAFGTSTGKSNMSSSVSIGLYKSE
jgi:hypothetical protein